MGSSFLPSEMIAAFLWAQLEHLDAIQNQRTSIWHQYSQYLSGWAANLDIGLPVIPEFASNNAHMFYMVCKNHAQRNKIISLLKDNEILPVFHYLSLHSSPFYKEKHDGRALPESDKFSDGLVRLPFYFELRPEEVNRICKLLYEID
jgi:dTDP-4-amino-4,6-dideoxygalactose transaminase